MKNCILLILLIPFLSSCAPATYKKADLGWYGGREGYLDKEIGDNQYVLEYSQIGGYNYDLEVNRKHWLTRANELCPNWYKGNYEVVDPWDAHIEEFYCPQRFCGQYPLVSGIITCN